MHKCHGGNEIILTTGPMADCNRKVYILIKPSKLPKSFSSRRITRQYTSKLKGTPLINAWIFVIQ